MAKLSITEVSERWGVSRPTLYRYKDQGRMTFEKDGRKVVIDSSEALRVLGNPLSQSVKADVRDTVSTVTSPDKLLEMRVEMLQQQVSDLRESLEHSRKSEDDLRGIVGNQTRLLEDKTMSSSWLSKVMGRK